MMWVKQVGLSVFLLSMLSVQPLAAAETDTGKNTDIEIIDKETLPQFVEQISQDYYQQLQMVIKYYQLYQQKRDPRGFNVWHLRGFTPSYTPRETYYQQLASQSEILQGRQEAVLVEAFSAIGNISKQLLIAFRDNDAAAYQQAKTLISSSNQQVANVLCRHGMGDDIKNIQLN